MTNRIVDFIRESNRMSRISRRPSRAEILEYRRFMERDELTVDDLVRFAATCQPGAELRERAGVDVFVGDYLAPPGGEGVRMRLEEILEIANRRRGQQPIAYQLYIKFLKLHPFSDCNGRSGRMLWMWIMRDATRGFLHTFHNQALAAA